LIRRSSSFIRIGFSTLLGHLWRPFSDDASAGPAAGAAFSSVVHSGIVRRECRTTAQEPCGQLMPRDRVAEPRPGCTGAISGRFRPQWAAPESLHRRKRCGETISSIPRPQQSVDAGRLTTQPHDFQPPLASLSPGFAARRQRRHPARIPPRLPFRQWRIPRSSRTRSAEASACTRKSPQRKDRNALLSPVIPAYSRPDRRY
jgi:hypothetical protein